MELPEPQRWNRINTLLAEAQARAPDERAAFLDRACDDPALRDEVASLLEAASTHDALLDAGAPALARPLFAADPDAPVPAGTAPDPTPQIGPYRLVERIGEGGTSVVYRARRADKQFERTVAIKVLRRVVGRAERAERFRAERQILASLSHPHLAEVYDGGVTEDGRPYLVMEHVDGRPLTEHCRAEDCPLGERLSLFRQAAEAVQAAHEQLVVHRDLKPSNVLVERDTGQVKLLDFGIAKMLGELPGSAAPSTRTGRQPMTPAYAAPEQVKGEAISVATDTYGLGVLLYELLTGERPYGGDEASPYAVARAVCEDDPPLPSAVVEDADRRSALQGDLDAIITTALRKDPEARYDTADDLLDDLDRYQDDRPLQAQRGDWTYRARKFVRRHQWGVSIAAMVTVVIASLIGLLLHQQSATERQRDRARVEAQTAQQVTDYLVQLFEANRLQTRREHTLEARSLLKRGRQRIRNLSGQPVVQARLLRVMGEVHLSLGEYERARTLYDRALTQHRSLYSEPHPRLAQTLAGLGNVFQAQGAYEKALSRHRTALAMHRALSEGPSSKANLLVETGESLRKTGALDSAETVHRRALSLYRQAPETDSTGIASALSSLSITLRHQGDLAQSETMQRKALALYRRHLPPDHLDRINTLQNLAAVLADQGKYEEAEKRFRRVIATYRESGAGRHPDVAQNLSSLGVTLRKQGQFENAEQMYRTALSIEREHVDAPHPRLATCLNNLGVALKKQEEYERAARVHQRALSMRKTMYEETHPAVTESLSNLAALRYSQGRLNQAAEQMRTVVQHYRTRLGDDHPRTALVQNNLAVILSKQDRHEAAIPLYKTAVPTYEDAFSPAHPRVVKLKTRLAESLLALDRHATADSLLTATHQTIKGADAADSSAVALIHDHLANFYEMQGNAKRAAMYRQDRHPTPTIGSSE